MNQYLLNLNDYFTINKLSLNVNKTVHMTFGCYEDSVPLNTNIFINNLQIHRSNNVKYLGVLMDYNLKWNMHIAYVLKKARYFLYLSYKLKHLPIKVLETIYYAFVYSILNYSLIIWGGAYETELKPLISLQNRFAKLLNSTSLPTLNQLYITNCISYHYPRLKYLYINSNSRTRNKDLSIPLFSKTIAKKNSIYTAIKYFNKLPAHLKNIANFNKNYKKKIMNSIKEITNN